VEEILTPLGLADIIENYAQVVAKKDPKTGRVKREQLFPRYHQLDVVRKLLAHAGAHGVGRRYLIQHSAGSGKSNSIAWLAHQLIVLTTDERQVFDSIIVVTDRRILDQQIRDSIRQFAQIAATVGHAEHSGDLRRFIESGKKIIITTVQKFPFILDDIGSLHRDRRFAIIIDEAHSSQGGKASAAVNMALSGAGEEDEEDTPEDRINRIERAIQYFHAMRDYLGERRSPYRAIVAFSGEHEYGGVKVTEAALNQFPSRTRLRTCRG
jgi:type I restriction enzyme R subunit